MITQINKKGAMTMIFNDEYKNIKFDEDYYNYFCAANLTILLKHLNIKVTFDHAKHETLMNGKAITDDDIKKLKTICKEVGLKGYGQKISLREIELTLKLIAKLNTKIEKYYSVYEISNLLKMKSTGVREYLKQGKIKGVKLNKEWRISETNLKNFVSNLTK